MHCIMLNIQSLCGWRRVRSSPGGQECERPRGRNRRLSGVWGTERPKGYRSPDVLGVGPVEFHENKSKGNLFFAFHSPPPSCKHLIHQKVNAGMTVKEEIPWVFPFCSVFWNCPHLLVKAVTQGSKQLLRGKPLSSNLRCAAWLHANPC